MELIGYANPYTNDPDGSVQVDALKVAGCTILFVERPSVTTLHEQTAFEECMGYLRRGDTLMVVRVERMAQSISDLQDLLIELGKKQVFLKVIEQPFDTGTVCGKAFLDMLGVFAEFETNVRRERQIAAMAKAKSNGSSRGRKPSVDTEEVKRLWTDEKLSAIEIARRLNIGRSTVYKVLSKNHPEK
jgi:DNA invertase Pin-like site-specific DNA recombinase